MSDCVSEPPVDATGPHHLKSDEMQTVVKSKVPIQPKSSSSEKKRMRPADIPFYDLTMEGTGAGKKKSRKDKVVSGDKISDESENLFNPKASRAAPRKTLFEG